MSLLITGIRDLKAQLSSYVREVKRGATVIITERGKPVGRIVSLSSSPEDRLQELIQAGLVAWSGHKLGPAPAPVAWPRSGQMIADLLLEDRE
jgi:prevent-host-death family protein